MIDQLEIAKFDALAKDWWESDGPMKPLHQLNPIRLQYIDHHAALANKTVLDIGCGGGLLTEAMARSGAKVTGIDLSESLIKVAQQHAASQSLDIHYQFVSSNELARQNPQPFEIITCMELLEHVPNPNQIIQDCANLVKPGGLVFFATINRNLKAFLNAILGAEYLLGLLPKGTHQYAKLIKPSELTLWASRHGLHLEGIQGVGYNPLSGKFMHSQDVSVNYMIYFKKIVL